MRTGGILQEGFTINEHLPDTLIDVDVWHILIALLSYIDKHHK
jgi:hypothetical protein